MLSSQSFEPDYEEPGRVPLVGVRFVLKQGCAFECSPQRFGGIEQIERGVGLEHSQRRDIRSRGVGVCTFFRGGLT